VEGEGPAMHMFHRGIVEFVDWVHRSSSPKGGKKGDAARGVVAVSLSLQDGHGWRPTRAVYGRHHLVCQG